MLVSRLLVALLVIGANLAMCAALMPFAGVPARLVLGDSLLGVALLLAGAGLLTPRAGWCLPVAAFGVFTIPSLVPPEHNLLYRNFELDSLWRISAAVAVLAIALYSAVGGVGLVDRSPVLRGRAENDGLDWQQG
jgi:hypothetical protein